MISSDPELSWRAGDPISQRAAEFYQRRRFWEWSAADQNELDAWLAESPLHGAAFLRVEGIVAHATRLMDADVRSEPGDIKSDAKSVWRFGWPLLIAASIAVFALFGFPLFGSLMQPPDRTYSTDVGGRTSLKFADGTAIDLDTDTNVRCRITSRERIVWLEKGEAWFHVAHDASNPFAVIVGRHRITDLGTEFLVRRGPDGAEVAVLHGKASLSTEGAAVALLAPGDDAVATSVSTSVTRRTPQELADALAWRQGMLVFHDTKLADVVRELNRYNTTKLVIADPAIADLRFNGEIKSDNFQDFLGLAESMMKLRASPQGKNILLSRDAPEKAKRAARTGHRQ